MTPNPIRDLYVVELLNPRRPAARPGASRISASGAGALAKIAILLAASVPAISIALAIFM